MKISFAMCSYNRASLLRKTLESIRRQPLGDGAQIVVCEDGYDGGRTKSVCEEFGAEYVLREHRPDQPYSNPAIPWNMAIKRATGDILILQNPECLHIGENVIERLVAPHEDDPKLAVFAPVLALHENGAVNQWYCHPEHSPRPFFFCGSVRRETMFALCGFDEDFGRNGGAYGYDDTFFGFCMQMNGIQFRFLSDTDALVHHNWHPTTGCYGLQSNENLFNEKVRKVMAGELPPISNPHSDWGLGD